MLRPRVSSVVMSEPRRRLAPAAIQWESGGKDQFCGEMVINV